MEPREITIVSTKDQTTKTINSSATTLAELKTDLRNAGINYADMTFFEGVSKVELKTDDSVLPHDIPYKGTITNKLVFMLTTPKKKTKSGASRAELYTTIAEKGLQQACVTKYGKNYTQCSNKALEELIEQSIAAVEDTISEGIQEEDSCETPNVVQETSNRDMELRNAMSALLDILYDKDIISFENLWEIKQYYFSYAGEKLDNKPSYSPQEISEMFKNVLE